MHLKGVSVRWVISTPHIAMVDFIKSWKMKSVCSLGLACVYNHAERESTEPLDVIWIEPIIGFKFDWGTGALLPLPPFALPKLEKGGARDMD